MDGPQLTLDKLSKGIRARVVSVDWAQLATSDGNRLRHFGFDEGVLVEPLHSGPLGADPIAIRVGRMTVAIRRAHARAVKVLPEAA